MVKWLKKKFDSPKTAEVFYFSTAMSVGVQTSYSKTSMAVQTGCGVDLVDVGVQTEHSCSYLGVMGWPFQLLALQHILHKSFYVSHAPGIMLGCICGTVEYLY